MRSHHPLSGGSRSSFGADHLAFVAAALFALACGAGPFLILLALDKWGPL